MDSLSGVLGRTEQLTGELTPDGQGLGGTLNALRTVSVPTSYNDLTDQPKINNVTLTGNKTGAQLGLASSSDIPTKLSDLDDDATHRLVTDTEKSTWNAKANVSDIPDISGKADKSTTLAGYGITNAYTKTETDNLISPITTKLSDYETNGYVADLCNFTTTYVVGKSWVGSSASNYGCVYFEAENNKTYNVLVNNKFASVAVFVKESIESTSFVSNYTYSDNVQVVTTASAKYICVQFEKSSGTMTEAELRGAKVVVATHKVGKDNLTITNELANMACFEISNDIVTDSVAPNGYIHISISSITSIPSTRIKAIIPIYANTNLHNTSVLVIRAANYSSSLTMNCIGTGASQSFTVRFLVLYK